MLRHRWLSHALRVGTLLCVAFAATACASFSPDGGMGAVNEAVAPTLAVEAAKIGTAEEASAAAAQTRQLLKSPLTTHTAVRLALLNNKGLQAAYNQLGIAEAVLVDASLPPNPRFSLSSIRTPVELDIEARVVADILALATLPARAELAADRFREAQLRAAEETLRVAMRARRSYYRAVAALQITGSLEQAVSAAETAAKLAQELVQSGAMNKLDEAREEAFHADLVIRVAGARRTAMAERERLIRALGLWGAETRFSLPRALPILPRRPRTLVAVETEALRGRIDVRVARIDLEALAKTYRLTEATRFINLLDIAGVARRQRDASGAGGTGGGAEMEFQVPIFGFGEARVRQAGETYMQAVNRLRQQTIDAASEAREAYQRYRSTYDVAMRYRSEVLPLRKTIADETMLRYGAMQIDVFSLLAEAQRRIAAETGAIEAQRDFWLAETDLQAAMVGGDVVESESAARARPSPADAAASD